MEKIHIALFRVVDEDPVDNYVFYIKNDLCYECDSSKTTLKDMFIWLERIIYPKFTGGYSPYMFKTFNTSFNDNFGFEHKDTETYINEIFDCSKPINLIRYPEYDGAGCWGESNGIRFEIKYGENEHMGQPHVHVSKGNESNRISIIDFQVLPDKHKRNDNLSSKNLKKALVLIKKYQKDFIGFWNNYSACEKIVDIEYFKNHKGLRLINPEKVDNFYSIQQEMLNKHKWIVTDTELRLI